MRLFRVFLFAFLALNALAACTNRGTGNGLLPTTLQGPGSAHPLDTAGGNPGMPADGDPTNPTPPPDPDPTP